MTKNKRLTILSEEEKFALYALPDFNESQQYEYFVFSNDEQKIIYACSNLSSQLYCALQIGYFKAKQTFFNFEWEEVQEEDIDFLIKFYFSNQQIPLKPISKYEYYRQVKQISSFYGYELWSNKFIDKLYKHVSKTAKRHINTSYILVELLQFIRNEKIIRPGYTVLQDIISKVINDESERLGDIILDSLDEISKQVLKEFLGKEDVLSDLSSIKADSKDFGYKIMQLERRKLEKIKPLYYFTKELIPKLDISRQNILYYGSLVNFYTIYELHRLKHKHSYLYLICYCWQRYLQITDNLINAFGYHLKQFDSEVKETALDGFTKHSRHHQGQLPTIGKLINLYVDESISNDLTFGEVRQKYVFPLMPQDKLSITAKQMIEKKVTELSLKWDAVDRIGHKFTKHLRHIFMTFNFSSVAKNSTWLTVITELKRVFASQNTLTNISKFEPYTAIIPKKLRPHLLITDEKGNITGLQSKRCEFWIYRQIAKRLESGELYVDDSLNYRYFEHELVSVDDKKLEQLDLSCLKKPIEEQLDELCEELKEEWILFDKKLKQGQLEHIQYDVAKKAVSFCKPKTDKKVDDLNKLFYEKMPIVDNTDVLRFVNEKCNFLSAFKPVQPRYVKQFAENNAILAVLISQAMNYGKFKFSKISDIPYHTLSHIYEQYFRKFTLQEANDIISEAISKLPIFEHYSFVLSTLYGSVDGQKLGVDRPTTKARHSKKYFGKGKGVVSYTLLVNHIPLQCELIGAHQHESYYVFDIYYNNTTDIIPEAITGDMHSINKANFIILHWFNTDFRPRFTDLKKQLAHLYCGDVIENYQDYWIKPVGQIDRNLIIEEWEKIKQIILTLATKETTQSNIIKKLCTYKQNRVLKAIFELDKLKRSIYTLRYLRDVELQKNVHRSQNRIESYHQLRAAILKVNGRKQLTGKTDLELEIANQCGRLVANAIIYYNSAILSGLLEKYQKLGNSKAIQKILKVSPVAWRNVHLSGHYIFCSNKNIIDLEKIISDFNL